MGSSGWILIGLGVLLAGGEEGSAGDRDWRFSDVTRAAGLDYSHGVARDVEFPDLALFCGGVAAGDYDRDGRADLFVVRGDIGPDLLFRNRGDGTFEEVGEAAGVALRGRLGCGPLFADLDGDGFLDLLVLGVDETPAVLLRNRGDGTFGDVTETSGLALTRNGVSATAGDYDLDGDLDLFLCQWGSFTALGHLLRNDGGLHFTDVGAVSGLSRIFGWTTDWSFTANFADIDSDGWPDLLVAADFGNSKVLRNRGDGTFEEITTAVLSDENGMGAAVGDYDGDGDLDWFVSSIRDPNPTEDLRWGGSGNRLYRNLGDGRFEDATDEAGVRDGGWGWAATFADLDNDADLDLYQVNGFDGDHPGLDVFRRDPAVLQVSSGDGRFTESAARLGCDVRGQGRGLACLDFDRDGDLDLFIANNGEPPRLLRNDGGNDRNWLRVRLDGRAANTSAIGARILATVNGVTQVRELRAGSNYASQNPAVAHFGLAEATEVERVEVRWTTGDLTRVANVAVNREIVITEPARRLLLRGDTNRNGGLEIADPIATLGYLFLGASIPCLDAADVDDDGRLDVSDAVLTLSHLFLDGSPPAPPYPECGADRSPDRLDCRSAAPRACPS